MFATIAFLAVVLVGVAIIRQRRTRTQSASQVEAQQQTIRETGRFHAVSIRSGSNGCTAAHTLHGHRYLSAAAPKLPLRECDASQCQCRYIHHPDRRDGADRRSPFQSGFGGSAARVPEDRRSRDRRGNTASTVA